MERKKFSTAEEFILNEYYELEEKYEILVGNYHAVADELTLLKQNIGELEVKEHITELTKLGVIYISNKISSYHIRDRVGKHLDIKELNDETKPIMLQFIKDAFSDVEKMKFLFSITEYGDKLSIRTEAYHKIITVGDAVHYLNFGGKGFTSMVSFQVGDNTSLDYNTVVKRTIERHLDNIREVANYYCSVGKERYDLPLKIEINNDILPSTLQFRETSDEPTNN